MTSLITFDSRPAIRNGMAISNAGRGCRTSGTFDRLETGPTRFGRCGAWPLCSPVRHGCHTRRPRGGAGRYGRPARRPPLHLLWDRFPTSRAGRYLRVIYVPDPEPESVFVITAYELKGKPLTGYKRRMRRRRT